MSTYVDDGWYTQHARATMTVEDSRVQVKVTYHGDNGKKFRVLCVQKPNQIGFHAKLPGDVKVVVRKPHPERRRNERSERISWQMLCCA
jgi:hypothetical protein